MGERRKLNEQREMRIVLVLLPGEKKEGLKCINEGNKEYSNVIDDQLIRYLNLYFEDDISRP